MSKTTHYIKTKITTSTHLEIVVYAGKRVSDALKEVTEDLTLYKGARLLHVLEAVYTQGRKDGARLLRKLEVGLITLRTWNAWIECSGAP